MEATTLRRREQVLRPVLGRLGRMRLGRLSPLHISSLLVELQEEGMGSRSLELAWLTLHACLEEAVKRGLLGYNPCRQAPRPKHEKGEARGWRLEEMRRFLQVALKDPNHMSQMLALMLLTGLRPGEALGLQWGDVDLEQGTLTVRRSLTWAGSEWHIGAPKTKAGARTVSFPLLTLRLLEGLPREGIYLFWRERPPTTKQVSQAMRELCEVAGVPRRPARYLRHAHASLLAAQGLDVKTLQRQLGHAHAAITLGVYAYALSEMDRRAADLVEEALGG